MNLKTDYKDEILKEGETYRTYNIVSDTGEILFPNVHLEKAYTPFQEGDDFGAIDINTITKLLEHLPIANGGTGATTVEQARTNLNVADKPTVDFLKMLSLEGARTKRFTNRDLLSVDTHNLYNAEINQPQIFGSENPLQDFDNCPYTGGAFYGYRFVLFFGPLIQLTLYEMIPEPGRIWSATYNTDTKRWIGWRHTNTTA